MFVVSLLRCDDGIRLRPDMTILITRILLILPISFVDVCFKTNEGIECIYRDQTDKYVITQDRCTLQHNGFKFNKHKCYKGSTYWRCRLAYKGCYARIITQLIDERDVIKRIEADIHNHLSCA